MSKLTLNNVGNLIDAITAQTTINNNNAAIVTALENTFSRDGTSPNSMSSSLDMNSNRIINLPQAISNSEPVTYQTFNAEVTSAGGVPLGGATNQVLRKNSGLDYDTSWVTVNANPGLITGGTNITVTGSLPAVIATILTPTFTSVNKLTITAPATGSTLTILDGKTLTVNNSITIAGTDSTVLTFQGTDTYVGRATTDTLTNKTFDTNAAGNVLKINTIQVSNVTGTGLSVVLQTNPVLVTPNLGTPSAGVLTSCTGLPVSTGISGLAAGVAAFLATPSSANLITAVTDETGTGNLVFSTTPTLVTPILGAATATTINKVTITQPASSAILTIVNTKTLTANNTLTLAGTDGTTLTFQATDTYVGRATTDTLTNKTFNTAGTGNVFQINGTGITAITGTGSAVLATTPTLVTPVLGVATATSINKVTVTAPATSATLTITDGQTLSYQEGSWTPTLIGSTSGSWVLNVAVGSYEKVGRVVTCRFVISATSASSPLGNIQIGGLPFASANVINDSASAFFSQVNGLTNSASYTTFCGVIAPNTSIINVYESGSGVNSQQATVAKANTTPAILGTIIYHT